MNQEQMKLSDNSIVKRTGQIVISVLVGVLILYIMFAQADAANKERLEALRSQREYMQSESKKADAELVAKINAIKMELPAKYCLEDPKDCPVFPQR